MAPTGTLKGVPSPIIHVRLFTDPSLSTGSTPALLAPPLRPYPAPSSRSFRASHPLAQTGTLKGVPSSTIQGRPFTDPLPFRRLHSDFLAPPLVPPPRPVLRAPSATTQERLWAPVFPQARAHAHPPHTETRERHVQGERENNGAARKGGARARGSCCYKMARGLLLHGYDSR